MKTQGKIKITLEDIYLSGNEKAYKMFTKYGWETVKSNYVCAEEKIWKTLLGAVKYGLINYGGFYDSLYFSLPKRKKLIIKYKPFDNFDYKFKDKELKVIKLADILKYK